MRPVSLGAFSGHLSEQNCSLSLVSSRLPIGRIWLTGMTAPVQVFGRRDDETDHTLKRPATKKRQGTKSRAVGQWLAASAMGI
jgi:hypothetical protein